MISWSHSRWCWRCESHTVGSAWDNYPLLTSHAWHCSNLMTISYEHLVSIAKDISVQSMRENTRICTSRQALQSVVFGLAFTVLPSSFAVAIFVTVGVATMSRARAIAWAYNIIESGMAWLYITDITYKHCVRHLYECRHEPSFLYIAKYNKWCAGWVPALCQAYALISDDLLQNCFFRCLATS